MRFLLFILLIQCSINTLYSQHYANYIPLELEQLEYEWQHPIVDSSIIGHEIFHENIPFGFDGYSHLWSNSQNNIYEPIIHDGYLYSVYKTLYRNDIAGALIDKIDLETGETVWKTAFDMRDGAQRETVEKVVLREDTLVFYNIRVTSEELEFPIFPDLAWGGSSRGGVLTIRKYSIHTGELIDFFTADEDDASVKFLKPYAGAYRLLEPINDSLILYTTKRFERNERGSYLVRDSINMKGQLLNPSDTIYSIYDIDWESADVLDNYKQFYNPLHKELNWIDSYDLYEDGNKIRTEHLLRIHGIETGTDDIIQLDFIDPEIYNHARIKSKNDKYWVFHALRENAETFFITDHDFNLVQTVNRYGSFDLFDHIDLDSDGNFVFGSSTGTAGNYGFEILKAENGNITQLSSFESAEPYFISYDNKTIRMENGDYLLFIVQFDNRPDNRPGRFYTILRVKPEKIGIVSSTSESNVSEIDISIYPNPAMDEIFLYGENIPKISSLELYTSIGQKVKTQKMELSTIKLDNLKSGTYLIKVIMNNGTSTIKKFIKL